MKVRLSKVEGGTNLRTSSVEGECQKLPAAGERFNMIGQGLVIGTHVISTSLVVEVIEINNHFHFTTETGSVYKLELIGKAN